jgi:hypothetical protein
MADNPTTNAGQDILAALRARGIHVWLREDGTPAAGPRDLLDPGDLAVLNEHRDLVIAALHEEEAP